MSAPTTCFAVAAPGLEGAVAAELAALGLAGRPVAGGVAFEGGLAAGMKACLWLRTATSVRLRLGEVAAPDERSLVRGLRGLVLAPWVAADGPVPLRATSRRSRLKHTGLLTDRLAEVLGVPTTVGAGGLLLRVDRDRAEVSVDLGGDRLHQRGWRKEGGPAPLRETLAAGLLHLLGWRPEVPLVDPMCGSGTLVIEAALQATRTAPGLGRTFAFQALPAFDPGVWEALVVEAEAARRPAPAALVGSDRHRGAVASAGRNARRAGVAGAAGFEVRDLAEARPPAGGPGLLLTNPPYGGRIDARGASLAELHDRLGALLRGPFQGWTGAFITPRPDLARRVDPSATEVARLQNGGLTVGLYRVPPRG